MSSSKNGFTLIELMLVVIIIAIFTAIALPSYQYFIKKKDMAQTQQEMLKLADRLERHKAQNFSYKKFDPKFLYSGVTTPMSYVYVPDATSSSNAKYKIEIKDISESNITDLLSSNLGKAWSMKASPMNTKDSSLYTFLLTSHGVKCKTKAADNVSFTVCNGDGVVSW